MSNQYSRVAMSPRSCNFSANRDCTDISKIMESVNITQTVHHDCALNQLFLGFFGGGVLISTIEFDASNTLKSARSHG